MEGIKKYAWLLAIVSVSLLSLPVHGFGEKKITIGGKNFTEQYILPELAKIVLEQRGFEVILKTGVGSTVARRSLENKQIDLYYEYTGTAYTVYYKQSDRNIMTNREKCYAWVKKADADKGLVWLEPVNFNNTYTLMMRKKQAEELGIVSISNLSDYLNDNPDRLIVGVNAEFWERPDGFKPLMKRYGFTIPYDKVKKMDSGLVYKALKDKQVDVSMGFATDGRIAAFGFINLEDDESYFPIYNPAPVVRASVLSSWPEIRDILRPVSENLFTEKMQNLNADVDIEHRDVHDVAYQWLENEGLLK
jgi:osmoprotectant transport system substrate-binding protein